MKKNVGKIDRILRFFLGLFLLWSGLLALKGIDGRILGILVALVSVMPFTMSTFGICPVFRWFGIHSLSKREPEIYGDPYLQQGD